MSRDRDPRTAPPSPTFGAVRIVLLLGALGGLGLAGALAIPRGGGRDSKELVGAPVRRGKLRFATTAGGNLRAADTLRVVCEVEGRTTILSIVPEGSQVKAGDLVGELDATTMAQQRIEQSIRVANAESALVKATQLLEIQDSQNDSDVTTARQKQAFAEQDLEMFLEGERSIESESALQEIELAREEARRNESQLAWSEKLIERGFLTATEVEVDRISKHRSDVKLRQAQQQADLLERYKLPRRLAELEGALDEARRELKRVELQASARRIDLQSNERSARAAAELEAEKLRRLDLQISKASLRAPCDGYVVYAQRDWDEPPIQAGASVREREEVLSIPNTAAMVAEIKIHESVLEQVAVGQSCRISFAALPGVELHGTVGFVAVLPDQQSRWSNPNTRVYRADVRIGESHPYLRPGMSCAVEILVEEVADALHVPVQAAFADGRSTVCFVVGPDGELERREIVPGRFDEKWLQVLDGLAEGEIVRLEAPAGALAPMPSSSAE